MQFRTTIDIKHFEQKIDHTQSILSLGSCFANNMAEHLARAKFSITASPTGILFNPESIAMAIDRFDAITRGDSGAIPVAEDLCHDNGRWFSFDFHSDFSHASANNALAAMQQAVEDGAKALDKAQIVIITFGSAFVYRLRQSGEIVANCHKQPHSQFLREMLSVEQIASRYIALLQGPLAKKQVILTLSPVRHLADGAQENSLSKATLRVAIGQIIRACQNVHYFPSYEIMMDELRDYRFYADDMAHPSHVATDYIWQRFSDTAFSGNTQTLNERIEHIVKASEHRPFNPASEEYKTFCLTQLERITQLEQEYPYISMTKEKEIFNTYL